MKLALLTGASSGIGQKLAPLLAKEGYELLLVGRNRKGLEATLDSLPKGSVARIVEADLSDNAQTDAIVAGEKQVDLLVNMAGYGSTGKVTEIPDEEFERSWRVNFLAPMRLIRRCLPAMVEAGEGTIVNVTSGVATRALPFIAPYAAAKAALNAATDSLRIELAGSGVHVCLFSPGPVDSGFQRSKKHFGVGALQFPKFYGASPEGVALRVLTAIQRQEPRVMLGGRAKLAKHLQYWSPRLTDRIVRAFYRIDGLA